MRTVLRLTALGAACCAIGVVVGFSGVLKAIVDALNAPDPRYREGDVAA